MEILDRLIMIASFGAVVGVIGWSMWLALKDYATNSESRKIAINEIKKRPLGLLWNVTFVVCVTAFFVSLLLAALGFPTFWR